MWCVETREPFPYRVGNGHPYRSSLQKRQDRMPRHTAG
jgi:hypothetical protein